MSEDTESKASPSEPETPVSKKTRARAEAPEVWLHWIGGPRAHTPPLPSHDLGEAEVRTYLGSQEAVDSYVRTGLWESLVPAGALPEVTKAPKKK